MGKVVRSKTKMTYHGRSGYPVIHHSQTGKKYIMVRHPSGRGNKRLYLNRQGNVPVKHRSR